jgi:hypothetical protein
VSDIYDVVLDMARETVEENRNRPKGKGMKRDEFRAITFAEQVLADATRIAELERLRWPDGRPAAAVGLDELVCDCDPPKGCEPEICRMLEDWHPPAVVVS